MIWANTCLTVLQLAIRAMEDACGDIATDAFHGWICHARHYFTHYLPENIGCDAVAKPKQMRGSFGSYKYLFI